MTTLESAPRACRAGGPGRGLLLAALCTLGMNANAHELIARCTAPDAKTVECRGGYAHGEGAPGKRLQVIAHDGSVLLSGQLDAGSRLRFVRPAVDFYVLFDVGPGHQVVIEQEEIAVPKASPANVEGR